MNAKHLTNAPEGIVRIFVASVDNGTEERAAARKAAQKVAHTIHVGRTPVGKPVKGGFTYDFAPVTRQSLDEGSAPSVADVKPSKKGGKKGGKKGKRTNTFVADVIAPRAARRAAAKCKRCMDWGIVPTVGKRAAAGLPFRTYTGATGSTTAAKCPTCKGKSNGAMVAGAKLAASA